MTLSSLGVGGGGMPGGQWQQERCGNGEFEHMGAERFNQKIGWKYFGTELKLAREEKGLSQQQLGALIFVSGSYVGQFESATRKPQLDVAERIDVALDTKGRFTRMCQELIDSSPFSDNFAIVAELEQQAISICEYGASCSPACCRPRPTRGPSTSPANR
ncbi:MULTISPECIES: helix-turn-helix transcriptional regulator [unclassified Kitasatospora]|uniref:helix-turn-helix domain-containing protein n=1 Tax=unclassified Kitasatospora TaxID=2633591 RepID=UPI002474B502|nr:helix-turn-helix transcriptional regulator [Kitasatospora sp. GAS204B]